jgi:UDP:flavonoid glycosyltransferase YjiC (YdhE family)
VPLTSRTFEPQFYFIRAFHAPQMRIALLTTGSRGDVQPVLALALGLTKAGHVVSICASPNHEKMVVKYGIEFHPIGVDTQELLEKFKTGKGE